MKTIGLLGGMSWESTLEYYRAVNLGVKARLGSLHSAKVVMVSLDFDPIENCQRQDDWAGAARILSRAAAQIELAGADFLLICTNTMHKVADQVAAAVQIPLVHIADATGQVLKESGVTRAGLLGTAFTMEQDFYKGRLEERFGISVLVPEEDARKKVHDVIFQELCQGRFEEGSRQVYLKIIDDLAARGAQAVILGCTEIGLLVRQTDTPVPLVDTTAIHAARAVDLAMA